MKEVKKGALRERWYDECKDRLATPHKVRCSKCQGLGHRASECPRQSSLDHVNSIDNVEVESEEVHDVHVGQARPQAGSRPTYQEEARKVGNCPDCGVLHTWNKMQGGTRAPWPSDQYRNCPKFLQLSSAEKGHCSNFEKVSMALLSRCVEFQNFCD